MSKRLPTDPIYAITDVYYNAGRWYYTLGQLSCGSVITETSHLAASIDASYVLLSGVT